MLKTYGGAGIRLPVCCLKPWIDKLGILPENPEAGFNMTVLVLRLSKYRNGVSKKHGEVARRIWQSLWAEFLDGESGIDHITNGVHIPTWIEPKMQLKRMLNDRWRPIQIIFAGKAHPADDPGKRIMQRIFNAA